MLRDALLRALEASEVIGARGIVVHAKNQRAKEFYERYDFEPLPGSELHLAVLIKDIQNIIRE